LHRFAQTTTQIGVCAFVKFFIIKALFVFAKGFESPWG
jgi:hypothetical protein